MPSVMRRAPLDPFVYNQLRIDVGNFYTTMRLYESFAKLELAKVY
jgi:hypothetical protein